MNIKDWLLDVTPFRRKRTASFLLPAAAGLGIGLVAGVGLGLLYAPATGEEARLRLRDRASRVKDRAADLAHKARCKIAGVEQLPANHS